MIAIGNHDFDPFPDRPSYHLQYINKHGEAIGKKLYLQHLLGGRACEAHRGGGGTAVTVTVT